MLMFQSIRGVRPRRNKFDLSHERKLSCNMGELIPVLLEEIVPGDSFRVSTEIMMRLAPMLAPIMHRVNVYTHYFFVPNRLVWNEWEDFITGGEDGLQEPVAPHFERDDAANNGWMAQGTLSDYFGLPIFELPIGEPIPRINLIPFRAYQMIYNEYYRDQNLTPKVDFNLSSGAVSGAELQRLMQLRYRAWEKDYFTSALPSAQRGNPVTIPGQASYLDVSEVYNTDGTTPASSGRNLGVHDIDAGDLASDNTGGSNFLDKMQIQNLEEIGIDINDLRRSNALQKWLELASRGGSRYIEQIKAFFGVTSSDARLQRPQYLGGGKQNVIISEVLQTAETGTTPQGNMTGHGVSVGSTNRFKKSFEEHGFVIGIMSVLPRTAYQQGIHRLWSREEKFDYYFPQFAHLGEQAILNKEIFIDDNSGDNDGTWGYQARFAEYKHRPSQVAGDFRSTLNFWHMGRIFSSRPPLNTSLTEASDVTHRIFANTEPTDDKLWVQIYNRVDALRPMPYYGTPRL